MLGYKRRGYDVDVDDDDEIETYMEMRKIVGRADADKFMRFKAKRKKTVKDGYYTKVGKSVNGLQG